LGAQGRLRRSSPRPNRIFDAVRVVMAETGVLTGKTRRAMDSTILDDAVATQDTVTQLIAAVRRVARSVPGATEVIAQRCTGHDTAGRGEPVIAWDDRLSEAREDLWAATSLVVLTTRPRRRRRLVWVGSREVAEEPAAVVAEQECEAGEVGLQVVDAVGGVGEAVQRGVQGGPVGPIAEEGEHLDQFRGRRLRRG
jgi:hypothetical protein